MRSTVPHTGPYDSDFDVPAVGDVDGYEPDHEEKTTSMIAHLLGFAGLAVPFGSIIGPLVVYLVKRDESAYIEDQAREALNFQIWMAIAFVVSAVLILVGIGIVLLPLVGLAWLVGTIVGALRAKDGEWYRYPWTVRLVK